MEINPDNAGHPAPEENGMAADESLLNPEAPAGGAPAGDEGQGKNPGSESGEGGDQPLLTPEPEKEENPNVGAPESYEDFTLPEGFTLDEEVKGQIGELFKGMNISQAGAQKLIDAYTRRVISQKEADLNELNEKRKAWRKEVRKSPTYETDKAYAVKGIRAVVNTPEEKALFTDSWLSDHPALFGVFVKVGRLLGEDSPLPNGGKGAPDRSAESRFPIKM
jgi:hypothetical protein